MQEKWIFKNTARLSLGSLASFLEGKKKELEIFLSYYLKGKGATAENIQFVGPPVFTTSSSGTFKVTFDVSYYNLCLGIDDREKDKMEITFDIMSDASDLRLLGEEWATLD